MNIDNNEEKKVVQVPIEDIIPNRFQPRLAFDEEGLKELSESIKQHGIIQPLVLRRLGNKYEIIAGERRFKASTMAGLKTVPAIISDIDDNQSAEIALVENIQRRNLTPIEEAKSYKNLLDRGYMTQEQLAEKMGVSQSSIANKLRLLNLAPEVQDALLQEKISERHARSLLSLPKDEQGEWLKRIINKRLTVRQLDLEIKKSKGEPEKETTNTSLNQDINTMINNSIAPKAENNIIEEIPQNQEPQVLQNKPSETISSSSNKFFNFLEDSAANMSMDTPTPAFYNDVEVLEELELSSPNTEEEEEIRPFFFGSKKEEPKTNNNIIENNNIEEVKEDKSDSIINPMDAVMKLDPNYNQIVEEEKGTDIKTAINEVRNFVTKMQNNGFNMSLEELDLTNSYQITINIIKNEDE